MIARREVNPLHPCPSCGRASWCHWLGQGTRLRCMATRPKCPEHMDKREDGSYGWQARKYVEAYDGWLHKLSVQEGDVWTRIEVLGFLDTARKLYEVQAVEGVFERALAAQLAAYGVCGAMGCELGRPEGDETFYAVFPMQDREGACGMWCVSPKYRKQFAVPGTGLGVIAPIQRLNPKRAVVLCHGVADLMAGMSLKAQCVARPGWGYAKHETCGYLQAQGVKLVVVPVEASDVDRWGILGKALAESGIRASRLDVPAGGLSAWLAAGKTLNDMRRAVGACREKDKAEAA